jgi:ribosomal protein S18 acetylase RimI-like enzyme
MFITQASIEDAETILKLQKIAYQSEAQLYNDFSISPLMQTLSQIKADFASKVFLKAVADSLIVGSVRGYQEKGTCYVERLIVDPAFQDQGIGTALMRQIEPVFSEAKRFELFTGHRSEKNIHLYQKLGYREFRRETSTENLTFVFLEKRRK